MTVAVLTTTTGLTHELALNLNSLGDGFTVSNLGRTDIRLNLELTLHTVDDNLEMQLTHPGDDNLAGFLVGLDLQGGVLLNKLAKSNTHLFLVTLGLRLNGDMNNRLRELHGLEDTGLLGIAKRITGRGMLESNRGGNISGVNLLDLFTLIGVHLQQAAKTLLLALGRIHDVCA